MYSANKYLNYLLYIRSININLTCDENGNITQADYHEVQQSTFVPKDFVSYHNRCLTWEWSLN